MVSDGGLFLTHPPFPPQDDLLRYFPLLKSSEKLYAQDQIWKKICRDLLWEFIPSV